jgi:AAA ATPase domain
VVTIDQPEIEHRPVLEQQTSALDLGGENLPDVDAARSVGAEQLEDPAVEGDERTRTNNLDHASHTDPRRENRSVVVVSRSSGASRSRRYAKVEGMPETLASVIDRRDATGFVGRSRELAALTELFSAEAPTRAVHLHGPAGIGKSALLREVARAGRASGWTPRTIEGRDLPPTPEALADALDGIDDEERSLRLFDTYERISGLDGLLRADVLPGVSATTRVVFASRRPPARGWIENGWDAVTRVLEIGPPPDADAGTLLEASGISAEQLSEILASAAGSPLALRLLVDSPGDTRGLGPFDISAPEQVREVVRRLTDAELDPRHHDVLAVAALARVTTLGLLGAVLPDQDPVIALEWLASRSFAEPLAGGFTLHDLVRRAARADLRHSDPERERAMRRRIADHLHARAIAGELTLSIDLAHLIDDPVLRWGYSWEGANRYHADDLRPADIEKLRARMDEIGYDGWWSLSEHLMHTAPSRAAVVRNADEHLVGFTVALTPANAPESARLAPELDAWLRHAEEVLDTRDAVIWQAAVNLTGDPHSPVQAMLGMSGILRCGLANPRYAYLPINPRLPSARAFAAATGAQHLSELDVDLPDGRLECHLLDYGPGGVLGFQRDAVYRETGTSPPTQDPALLAAAVSIRPAPLSPPERARGQSTRRGTHPDRAD